MKKSNMKVLAVIAAVSTFIRYSVLGLPPVLSAKNVEKSKSIDI